MTESSNSLYCIGNKLTVGRGMSPKIALSPGGSVLHLTYGSLGPLESSVQTRNVISVASAVCVLLRVVFNRQTNMQTHRPHYNCYNRLICAQTDLDNSLQEDLYNGRKTVGWLVVRS